MVIVHALGFNDGSGVVERRELVHIQTLVTHTFIIRFKNGTFYQFVRSNEVQLRTPPKRTILEPVRKISAEWLQSYNEERPHDALAGSQKFSYRSVSGVAARHVSGST